MSKKHPELQKLFELRGQQGPGEEYFEEFLDEFHRRQREDLMKRSARSLFMERLSVWLRELGSAKWAYAAGVGYAALMIGFFAWPKGSTSQDLQLPGDRILKGAGHERVLNLDPKKREDEVPSQPSEF